MTATLGAVKNTKTATKKDEMSEADAGAIVRLCENAWEEFIPFLHYDVEIRTAICSTNAINALEARKSRTAIRVVAVRTIVGL